MMHDYEIYDKLQKKKDKGEAMTGVTMIKKPHRLTLVTPLSVKYFLIYRYILPITQPLER
jgi:hypothetical protein